MGAGLMSLTAVKALLKKMTDSHGQAFSHPDSKAKMCVCISFLMKSLFLHNVIHSLTRSSLSCLLAALSSSLIFNWT